MNFLKKYFKAYFSSEINDIHSEKSTFLFCIFYNIVIYIKIFQHNNYRYVDFKLHYLGKN